MQIINKSRSGNNHSFFNLDFKPSLVKMEYDCDGNRNLLR